VWCETRVGRDYAVPLVSAEPWTWGSMAEPSSCSRLKIPIIQEPKKSTAQSAGHYHISSLRLHNLAYTPPTAVYIGCASAITTTRDYSPPSQKKVQFWDSCPAWQTICRIIIGHLLTILTFFLVLFVQYSNLFLYSVFRLSAVEFVDNLIYECKY